MTRDLIQRRLERKQSELQRIKDARARHWSRITRSVRAIEKLNKQEARLIKPPLPKELKTEGYHDILKQDFDDVADDALN